MDILPPPWCRFISCRVPAAVDSAFISGPRVINAATLNSDGIVTDPSTSLLTISMPSDFNDKLASIQAVTVKGRIYLTRPDIRWVKFFHEYQFNLHVGARIELLFNTNDVISCAAMFERTDLSI